LEAYESAFQATEDAASPVFGRLTGTWMWGKCSYNDTKNSIKRKLESIDIDTNMPF